MAVLVWLAWRFRSSYRGFDVNRCHLEQRWIIAVMAEAEITTPAKQPAIASRRVTMVYMR